MARIKRGTVSKRKHNKVLALTKGYRGVRGKLIRKAHEQLLHSGEYAFHGRKLRKRDMRALWILRISQAVKQEGISYSKFINKLKKENILLDRKILDQLLTTDPQTFKFIVDSVKAS